MHAAMEQAGLGAAALRPARGSDPVGACLAALARVRASLEPPAGVEVCLPSCGEQALVVAPFAELHDHYSRLQQRDGRQSFDDQLYLAVADMLADPRHRAFIQRRYAHILVDEFQDLNGVQLALVDLLSRPRRDLFVVGDDDQLIYGWRFADLGGILGFHERMPPRPWSATYTLGTNYRCSRAIVAAGSRLIAHNARREAKDVRPREGAPGGSLGICAAASWRARAAAMCAFLRAERARLGCEWRALAVLCRFRAQQLPVALALDLEGIPRTALLSYRLFSDPAARLVRAYIDAVLAPHRLRGADLRLLVNRPERYVPGAAVAAVAAAAEPWQRLLELAAAEPAAGPQRLRELVAGTQALARELTGRGEGGSDGSASNADQRSLAAPSVALNAAQLVSAVVDDFGLQRCWSERTRSEAAVTDGWAGAMGAGPDTSGPDCAGPLHVLDALLLLADCRPEIPDFLAEWDRLLADEEAQAGMADDSLAREESADDRVVIGTIHAAKGREYRCVVIPEYACKLAEPEAAQIEEERRVLYVGVTRAQDAALITVDPTRPGPPPLLLELAGPEQGGDAPGERWADAWRTPRASATSPSSAAH
jgi:superfamily I DNA/RNA helicase